jgi:hypothetical protein
MNLVPETPAPVGNYWCTWALQNYIHGQGDPNLDLTDLEGPVGANYARNNLTEDHLLGSNGWLSTVFPDIRQDLLVILDDGWDLPIGKPISGVTGLISLKKYLSSFILHPDRYPSFKGRPEERLKRLNEEIQKWGWRGLGVWVAAQEASEYASFWDFGKKKYWKERAMWSKHAGIMYWKVDWGIKCQIPRYRCNLTEIGKKYHPNLIVEHAHCYGPFNQKDGDGTTETKFIARIRKLLEFSDTVRLYDVSPQLALPSMLDRAAKVLHSLTQTPITGTGKQILHTEDEVYLAAVLGCTMGIMRYPFIGKRVKDGKEIDFSFCDARNNKRRIDEVRRAVRWHRIAPPFSASAVPVEVSPDLLTDSWHFKPGEFWDKNVFNRTIIQRAPAMLARGLQLPRIEGQNQIDPKSRPFIVTCRHPNGTISIGSFGRMDSERGSYHPTVHVIQKIVDPVTTIGIFGHFERITLESSKMQSIQHIWAQDLIAREATEITAKCEIKPNAIQIPGDLIKTLCTVAASLDDISDPGIVLKFEK